MPDTATTPVPKAPVRPVRVLLRLGVTAAIGTAALATLKRATAAAETSQATMGTARDGPQVLHLGIS